GPARWILPLWALAPFVIGYAYSVWRSPVLQYSVLLFSFPFLLYWVFGGSRTMGRNLTWSWAGLVACTASITLFTCREHHLVFRDTPYAAMVRVASGALRNNDADHTLVLFDAPRPQVEFHLRRYDLIDHSAIHWPPELKADELERLINDTTVTQVVLGTTNGCEADRLAQLQARFPYIRTIEDHVEGQVHVFARTPASADRKDRRALAELSPGRRMGDQRIPMDLPMVHDGATRTSGWDLTGREYGPSLHHRMDPTNSSEDLYEAEALVSRVDTADHPTLVLQLQIGDSTVIHRATAATTMGDQVLITAALSPSWVREIRDPVQLSAYMHNSAKRSLIVHRIRLYQRRHDPVRDALLQPITDLGFLPK
ncbi:MAG: hypothetical protein IT225_09005, partial [Flavobacteriales bacterium]|nr:hypothetical protein [Flavobacteriales bacterium]